MQLLLSLGEIQLFAMIVMILILVIVIFLPMVIDIVKKNIYKIKYRLQKVLFSSLQLKV